MCKGSRSGSRALINMVPIVTLTILLAVVVDAGTPGYPNLPIQCNTATCDWYTDSSKFGGPVPCQPGDKWPTVCPAGGNNGTTATHCNQYTVTYVYDHKFHYLPYIRTSSIKVRDSLSPDSLCI